MLLREIRFVDGASSFRCTSCRKEAVLWQVEGSSLFQSLISFTSHENDDVAKHSERLLYDLSEEDFYRPKLGNAGAITWLVRETDGSWEKRFHALSTLCLFCQEAVNRVKLRDVGALELFLTVLSNDDYAVLHCRVISALYRFVYWKEALERLVYNNLVDRLLDFSKKSAELGSETLLEKLVRGREESSQDDNSIEFELDLERKAPFKRIKPSHDSPTSSSNVEPAQSEHPTNIFDAWRQRREQSESEWSGSGLGSPGSSPAPSGWSSASPPPDAVYSPSQSPTRVVGRFDGVHLSDGFDTCMYPHSSNSSSNPSSSPPRSIDSLSPNRKLGEAPSEWVYSSESESEDVTHRIQTRKRKHSSAKERAVTKAERNFKAERLCMLFLRQISYQSPLASSLNNTNIFETLLLIGLNRAHLFDFVFTILLNVVHDVLCDSTLHRLELALQLSVVIANRTSGTCRSDQQKLANAIPTCERLCREIWFPADDETKLLCVLSLSMFYPPRSVFE